MGVCPLLTLLKKEVSKSSRKSTLSSSKKLGGMKLRLRHRWAVLPPNVRPYQKVANLIIVVSQKRGGAKHIWFIWVNPPY